MPMVSDTRMCVTLSPCGNWVIDGVAEIQNDPAILSL
jgi:hypothetical protein